MIKLYTFKISPFVFALIFIGFSPQNLNAYELKNKANIEEPFDGMGVCVSLFNRAVNCDFTESEQIQFSISPVVPASGFSNVFYLTDLNGIILQSNNTTSFSAQASGAYKVIALNYENGTTGLPGVGENINGIDESKCTNFLTKTVYICPSACKDIYCDDEINIISSSQNTDVNYSDVYILVNSSNAILDFANDASNLNIPSVDGTYFIFSINYESSAPPEGIIIGSQFTAICIDDESCYELGSVQVFSIDKIAPSLTCPSDMVFTCKASMDAAILPVATYTDGCSPNSSPTFTDDLSGYSVARDSGRILRTWRIEDACGNESSCIQTINILPIRITGTPNTPPSSCDSNNGRITVIAAATSEVLNTLEYSIDGGVDYFESNTFTGLGTGKYNIVIRTIDGHCSFTGGMVDFTVAESPTINSVTPTDITDCDLTNGSITISASGNGNAISYSINGGQTYQTSNVFSGLGEGTYSIRIKYSDGLCEAIGSSVGIVAPEEPEVTGVFPFQNPSDCGLSDGFVNIQASGSGNLEYQLLGVRTWQSSSTFSNLSAGSYKLQMRYLNGSCEVTVSENIVLQDPSCEPECKDIFTRSVICDYTEGTINFSIENDGNTSSGFVTKYALTSLSGDIMQSSNSPTFSNVLPGAYYVAAINYELPEFSNTFDIGQNIFDLNQTCYDVNYENIGVCPDEDCDYLVCEGDINLNIQGGNSALPTVYTLVNEFNAILEVRNDLNFNFLESGKFFLFAFNVDDVNNIEGLAVGLGLSGVCIKEDVCYDISSIAFEIDDDNPTIECPIDISVKCDESTAPSNTGNPIVGGGCELDNSDLIVDYEDRIYDSPNCEFDGFIQRITREWTITDACGNTSSCSQTIYVKNEEKPVLICVNPLILECDGDYENDINIWLGSISATAECGLGVNITNSYQQGALPAIRCSDNQNEMIVVFTATDQCGNSTSCSSQIIIEDNVKPVINCVSDLTMECGSDYTTQINNWLNSVTANDQCDENVNVEDDHNTLLPSVVCDVSSQGLAVTFTATDDCGNTDECTAVIRIVDTAKPIISCVPDLTMECGSDYTTQINTWLNNVSANDLCDSNVEIGNNFNFQNLPSVICSNTNQGLTVTFTATDDCGNTDVCTAVIRIVDNTDPIISCVSDLILECDGNYTNEINSWLNSVSANDICDNNVQVTNNYQLGSLPTGTCTTNGSGITVTFTATDDCGNTDECTAVIRIVDNTDPIISCVSDLILECDGNYTNEINSWLNSVSANDICDNNVQVTNNYQLGSLPTSTCTTNGSGITVTFTATDDCGNTNECTAVIRIVDNTDPLISCVTDLILECDGNYTNEINTWLNSVSANDICDNNVQVTNNYQLGSLPTGTCTTNGSGITVTFTATDDCGNTDECTAVIRIVDNTAPVISCVSDLILECDGNYTNEINTWLNSVIANDICDNNVQVTNNYQLGSLPTSTCTTNGSGITVTFTATDDCGNTDECTAVIRIVDNTDPIISCVSDLMLECDGNYTNEINTWLNSVIANDICDNNVQVMNNYQLGSLPTGTCTTNGSGITVTFTATDDCGNTDECTAVIRIVDNTAPVISCVSDLILECDGNYTNEINTWLNSVIANDICDNNVQVTNNYQLGSLPTSTCTTNGSGITVTFTATDDCGNTDECTAVIRIVDNTAPVISCVSDLILECDGNYTNEINTWLNSVIANDICDNNVQVTNNYQLGSLPTSTCTTNGSGITVTFTATDDCGNTDECTAVIRIVDNTDPIISCVSDLMLECDGNYTNEINTWLNSVIANDICDNNVQVMNNYQLGSLPTGTCTTNGSGITVTFTATDDCGNTDECTAVIRIVDNIDPVISCVSDLMLECDGNYTNEINTWLNSVIANDICDNNVQVTNNYQLGSLPTSTCTTNGSGITVTFTATDDCGNTDECTAVIRIVDNTDPVISCISDLILECDGNYTNEINTWLNSVIANDICDNNVQVTNNYQLGSLPTGTCTTNGSGITVTFTATDDCGNTDECTAVIRIVDNTDPVISCVSDLLLECDGNYTDEINTWLSSVIANDICDNNVQVTNNYQLGSLPTSTCTTNGGGITVTFTATDDCGNTDECTAVIRIVDNTDPVISCISDLILECDGNYTNEINTWLNSVSANDICDNNVQVTNNYQLGSLPTSTCTTNGGGITVTFTATDDCGNTDECTAVIRIVDNTDPIISCVSDLILECDGNYTNEINTWLNSVIANDICDNNVQVTNNYQLGSLPTGTCTTNGSGITVTFTATDDCGNTDECTAVIRIVDNTDPVISCVTDLILECDGNYTNEINTWLNSVSANDICDNNVQVTNNYTSSSLTDLICRSDGKGLEITFTATDDCGNTSTCKAEIRVNAQPLTIRCLEDRIIPACINQANIESAFTTWKSGVVVTGGCNPEIRTTQSGSLPISCVGGSIIVTFTATDECGTTSCTATFVVKSDTAPVFDGLIADKIISCEDAVVFGTPQYIDECGTSKLTFVDATQQDSCPSERTITRTWTVENECGGKDVTSASIIIQDNEGPNVTNPPTATITIECNEGVPSYTPNWVDNCSTISEMSRSSISIEGCTEIETFVYTATDACGNSNTVTRVVRKEDNTRPFFDGLVPNKTIECGEAIVFGTPSAGDNCTPTPSVTFKDTEVLGLCVGEKTITRIWTATDECGNTATTSASIIIKDTEEPILPNNLPQNITVSCSSEIPTIPQLIAQDGCVGSIIGIVTDNAGPKECPNQYQVVRQWTFEDECGNISRHQQIITVKDEIDPQWINLPTDLSLNCTDNIDNVIQKWLDNGGDGLASDNCGVATITNDYQRTAITCENSSKEVTFFANDGCGNVITASAQIILIDNENPVLSQLQNKVVDCDDAVVFDTPTVNDNCDNNVDLTFTDSGEFGICKDGSMTRTWIATDACGNTTRETQTITRTEECGPDDNRVERTICSEDLPFNYFGQNINAGGTYTSEQVDNNGCPYLEILVLTVTPKAGDVTTRRTICATDLPYVFNGVSYDASGTYRQSSEGCTADQVLVLTVTPKAGDVTTRRTVCATDLPYVFNGVSYDASGTYRQSSEGCTADQVLVLTVTPKAGDVTTRRTVCAADLPYVFNGVSYDASGTYRQSSEGCTADQLLVLTVTPKAGDVTTRRTVCATELPYVFNGVSYDASGTYRQSSEGCTADQLLVLTVTPKAGDVTTRRTVCATDLPYVFNGVSYDASGTYRQSSEGCTADQVLVLTVTPKAGDITTRRTVCATDLPYVFNGVSYDASGTYRQSSEGCTADQVLVLTVTPKAGDVTTRRTVCAADLPYVFNGVSYDASGTYRQSSEGCTADQVLVLSVIDKCNIVTEASDLTLTCSSLNSITIQGWIEDNANTVLSCSNSIVSHDYDGTMPTCDNPLTVTFTFGNLSCGDALTSTAQIILIDNDDPIIQNAPSNIVADCIEPVGQSLTAIDNCAGTITAEPVDVRTDGNCANRYLIERTWTFSDDCGNTVSHTQIINVTDDVSPVFTDVPGDIDVANESEVPEATEPTASDNCGTVNIRMDEERGVVDCGVIITRVWTATDACGNTSTASQVINVGIDLEVNTSVITNVSCFGSTDGSAEVLSAESGLTYLWSNGETTRVATQLGVGSHSVTVEASNGCRKVLTVQISQPEALDLDIINIIDANCLTNTLGSAEVTVEGGVGPFTYEWTNGTTTATLSGVTSGRYSVVVTDANGCTEEGSVDIGSVSSCNAELGDVVFEDLNRNGIQDENDPRIEGVTVILLDRAGNEINRTVTDENGMYWFSGLGSGEYILQFITPEGYISTIANGGVDDGLDSDVSIRTGLTEVITLGEGESNKTIDAGYYQNGSIGNYVWHDEDRDGLQDENELGKEGVKIWLLDETLEAIASTFTDENGYYIFNNIPPGVYYIELESREGIIFSSQNVGDNDDIDSDLDPNTLRTEVINLLSGENYENIDIGCYKAEEIIDLELEKSVSNGRPQVGESIVFTLKLTNKGLNDATGIEVEDIVPNGYGGILAISNGGSQTENVINWTDITLDAGKSIELKYRTSVLAQEEGMNYKNVAQVTASDQEDIDSTPDNDDGDQSEDDEDSAMVFVSTDDDYVDVSLTKEVDDSTPDIKDVITYTIRVRNDGNVPATEVEVTDYLPTAYCIEFINISNGGVLSGDKIIWSGLDLEPGESIELTFQATVAANAHGETVTNIAEVTSHVEDDIDSTPGNNDASEDDQDGAIFQVGRTSDLSLDKRIVNPSAGVGDVVKFEIELTNNGPDPVTFAEVEDVVPDGYADYANISHDGITYTNVIRWMASDLEVGESVIYTFDARVVHFPDVDCDYKNVAQVTRSTSNDPDSEPNNDNGDQSEDDEDWAELDVGQTKECIEIKSAVILEGGYDDGLGRMHTTLNQLGYLPGQKPTTFFGSREEAGQPYSQSPWFYGGSEGEELNSNLPEVGDFAGYPEDAVDYVLVSLRTDNSPESEICERAALVLQNGELVFFEDENCCDLNPQRSYYLVIQHRNHLPVMSHEKVAIVDGVLSYDFRIQNSYKSVLGLGQKEIKSGLFAMFAGNGDQQNDDSSREDINFIDLGAWMTEDGANSGYYLRDYDLNGDVNVHDKVLFLKNNGVFTDVRF